MFANKATVTGLELKIIGEDGNATSILGKAARVLRKNGMKDRITEFHKAATSGNYDHLLQVCMDWFKVE